MTGEGRSYKERQREKVHCPYFRKYLEMGSLSAHFQTHHGVAKEGSGQERDKEGGGDEPRISRTEFL